MAKYMSLWRANPNAAWPVDPAEGIKMNEMMFAAIDDLIKTGEIEEFNFFGNGLSGYVIASGDIQGQLRGAISFFPFIEMDVNEVVPYETGKEIMRAVFKAQAEAMELMKRA